MASNITIVNTDGGQSLSIAGGAYRIITTGAETGGAYAIIEMLVPPGGGPGPHAHAGIHEQFYVADGEIEFKTEAGKHIAKQGALVNIPLGGAVHSFKNISNETARLLCTVMPAGLDEFFQEIGTPVSAGTFLPPPPMDEERMKKLKQLGEKYGQQFFPPDYLG